MFVGKGCKYFPQEEHVYVFPVNYGSSGNFPESFLKIPENSGGFF